MCLLLGGPLCVVLLLACLHVLQPSPAGSPCFWAPRITHMQGVLQVSYAAGLCALLLLWGVYPRNFDFGKATAVSRGRQHLHFM